MDSNQRNKYRLAFISYPLLHKGHSKDYRPDLLQYRQMLATLDPLGMPLIGATLAGNGADDPLYFPTWKRLAELIGHLDFLFLADCKVSSWSNRAQIDREGGIIGQSDGWWFSLMPWHADK